MPLQIPTLDDRRYQELLDEALARIPVHNPEWTNFNKSDPGVTLIEVFAFLTESLLYRANQIPERNRRKFLSLLGVPLQPATSARGLVTFTNDRGPLQTITLNNGLEVHAGQVPFRTEKGLDVLPIEAHVYFKRKMENPDQKLKDYYKLLYASYTGQSSVDDSDLQLYETVPLNVPGSEGVDLTDTVDNSLWVALLVRPGDKPNDNTETGREALRTRVREEIAGKTMSLGMVPALAPATRRLLPGGQNNPAGETLLHYEIPHVPAENVLPTDPQERVPRYKLLDANAPSDVLAQPGVVEITLPAASELVLWRNLDPLEPGVGDFPPSLDDTNLDGRVITWLRIRSSAAVRARFLWVGINSVFVTQRAHVGNERLPDGTGEPDQVVVLSHSPIVPKSVRLTVGNDQWHEIDDLLSAGPEVPTPDLRQPPGSPPRNNPMANVFSVNPESGEIKFGDGLRGKRPPVDAPIRAGYDYGAGKKGNVGAGSINSSPALPAGIQVSNPVRTWNGADAESMGEGEKQIARYLQHRDRLVTGDDFETITLRTPGVEIGRVEVIPAFNPELSPNAPGGAPGAVTLLVIPQYDPKQPDAPMPDRLFLDTICSYLDPRRLVTTELFLRGPVYKPIWVAVGITARAGESIAQVREAVKKELMAFLSPLPSGPVNPDGWLLNKPIVNLELLAVASRVHGVLLVNGVTLAEGRNASRPQIEIKGLELPRVAGISVVVGEPLELTQLRGDVAAPSTGPARIVPVPVIPETC